MSNQNRQSPREIAFGKQFKRDLKKHYLETASLAWLEVLTCLTKDFSLPDKYRDHALTGNWVGFRDCHIKPDLVLIYEKPDDDGLLLVRLGTHAQLNLV